MTQKDSGIYAVPLFPSLIGRPLNLMISSLDKGIIPLEIYLMKKKDVYRGEDFDKQLESRTWGLKLVN